MSVKVTNVEENVIELEFSVDQKIFQEGVVKSYRKNVKRIQIPGFRKGKAPQKMIEKMYGPEVFYDDAINFVFPDAYDEAVKEAGITPVDRPEVDVKEVGPDVDLVLTAKVTVKPEVSIDHYKGIEIPKIEYTVSDEDVEREISSMAERNSRLVTVEDREAKLGDTAIIDYEGFVDEVAFEGGKGENHSLELGSGQFIPGFEDQIVGKKPGEEFDVNVTFPEEYHAEDLQGKEAVFKVKLNELKEKVVPTIDDEFAKDVSEFDTLEELKADSRKKLEQTAADKAKNEKETAILDFLCENLQANIPEVMVESQIDSMMKDFEMRISSQGIDMNTYMTYMGLDPKTMRDSFREQADRRVKTTLALEKILELENISATDEDAEAEIQKMADQYQMEVDKIKSFIKPEDVKEDLAMRKTMEFLLENAKEKKVSKKKEAEGDKAEEPAAKKTTAKKTTTKKTTAKKETAEGAEKKPAAKKTITKKADKKDEETK
ncbi:MAG: trigger factor [Clostridia bacterium]|nr:trigger factor [Clostridia bacterium]